MPKTPAVPTQILALERFLPYRLSIISNKVSATIAQTYQDKFALSIVDWRIMAILGEYPGVSADEVCQRAQMEKSIVSRALSKLLKRNLVYREFDEKDRRRSRLTLTDLGISVYDDVVPLSYRYEQALKECFSEQECAQLNALLEKLYDHVKMMKPALE